MTHVAPSISVIICAYTEARWNDLLAAVASVSRQRVAAHEIIVVIDHNQQLLARAQAYPLFDGIVLIENHQQQGLSGARNSGIAAARGDVLAFLDDDAIAAFDWIEQLIVGYHAPRVVGVGGAIIPRWDEGRPAWFPEEFDWVVGCTYRGMPRVPAPVRNLIGANMSLRRDVFAKIGGFRSDMGRVGAIPLGCEETELCIRIHQVWPEAVIAFVPAAQVSHRIPATRGRWSYFHSRCYAEGLSKALVSRIVGANDGLASERSYTLRTLPAGVVRGMATSLRGDLGGFGRALTIVAGLGVTITGYLRGQADNWVNRGYLSSRKHTIQEERAV